MPLNEAQKAQLDAPLSRQNVKERTQAGRQLSYIEAWVAISEANRIFGHDGWNRELIDLRCLGEPREVDGKVRVAYRATVRIHVGDTFRDGSGFGSGIDRDVDQAHESALKEAESDAMKRALMTFGNPFGLALYDKTQANVSDGIVSRMPPNETPSMPMSEPSGRKSSAQAKRDKDDETIKSEIDKLSIVETGLWLSTFDDRTAHLPLSWLPSIRDFAELHLEELQKPHEAAEMDEAFKATVG